MTLRDAIREMVNDPDGVVFVLEFMELYLWRMIWIASMPDDGGY